MNNSYKDYLQLHFIVILLGFTMVLGKLITIPADEIIFFRCTLAAIGMMAVIKFKKESLEVSRRNFYKLILTGVIVAIHWITLFTAVKIANPSTSLIGMATCSLWTVFIEPMVHKQKIRLLEIFLAAIVFAGLLTIFLSDFKYPLGLFLGVTGGLMAALFSVINSTFIRQISPSAITFYEMLGAAATVTFYLLIRFLTGDSLELVPTGTDWIYLLILSWVCVVYTYTTTIELFRKFSVFYVQLAINLEPVYGIILALLIFGESEVMNTWFYTGGSLVVLSVLLYPLLKRRFKYA